MKQVMGLASRIVALSNRTYSELLWNIRPGEAPSSKGVCSTLRVQAGPHLRDQEPVSRSKQCTVLLYESVSKA